MSSLKKLKAAKNRKELAVILGFKPSALTSIIYQTPLNLRYTSFTIPKAGGGLRNIKAPNPKLKKLQTHLANVLYECLAEIESDRKAGTVSHGFRRGRNTISNAKNHKRRRYVLNLDLADFFPSFNFGRVRGFFLKDKAFELAEEVATTIAQIACDGVALPQGSPSSPVISELISQILDQRMLKFAKQHRVTYSRYVDDITLSTNQKIFPSDLAFQDKSNPSVWALGEDLIKRLQSSGFTVNPDKTRMNFRGSRQTVTDLVVNEKVNIRSEYYRNARAMCDSLFQTGKYFHSFSPPKSSGGSPEPVYIKAISPLEGILSYIYSVTQSEDRRPVSDQRSKPRAVRKLFRRFLFYKKCIALDAPLIISEGKTDPIYLREAIKRRTRFHPLLGVQSGSSFKFSVRFFNYIGQVHEIMDLGGGSGDLKSIPLDYLRNLDPKHVGAKIFQHKPMAHPVILVLDNDDGLKGVAGVIKDNFGIQINLHTKNDFYHITQNLYLVKTPESNNPTCIEDLFQPILLARELNGKKFNPAGKIDPQTEYSKEVFAKAVVKPNATQIDFSGFDPLLERIVKAITHYKSVP